MSNEQENEDISIPLTLPEPHVNADDPWNDDVLERKQCADLLTNLIKNTSYSVVISLNGSWGSGKTFFLKRWHASLIKENIHAIYYNAWEDDFVDDPLIALTGTLCERLKDISEVNVINKIKGSLPLLRKIASNIIEKRMEESLAINISDLISYNQYAIDRYTDCKKDISSFKNNLHELTHLLKSKPLVFIIDELDRCKPTYAIQLLERIKHIFSVDNVVFVLGIDRVQLGHSLKCVYGNEMDVDGYLRRLFDYEFIMRTNKYESFFKAAWNRYNFDTYFNLIKKDGRNNNFYNDIQEYMFVSCRLMQLTLRQQEYAIRLLSIVLRNNLIYYPSLITILIAIKAKGGKLYEDFIENKINTKDIVDHFDYISIIKEYDTDHIRMMNVISGCLYHCRYDSSVDIKNKVNYPNWYHRLRPDDHNFLDLMITGQEVFWEYGEPNIKHILRHIELASLYNME